MHSYHCGKLNAFKFDFPEEGHCKLWVSVKNRLIHCSGHINFSYLSVDHYCGNYVSSTHHIVCTITVTKIHHW
jgi:hypothetical protein